MVKKRSLSDSKVCILNSLLLQHKRKITKDLVREANLVTRGTLAKTEILLRSMSYEVIGVPHPGKRYTHSYKRTHTHTHTFTHTHTHTKETPAVSSLKARSEIQ